MKAIAAVYSVITAALLDVALFPTSAHSQKILTSLAELDELRSITNSTNIERIGNVDVINDGIGLCNIAFMMPFSFFPGPPPNTPRTPFPFMGVLEGSLAVALAIQHLNTGDGSVIPEVGGLNERCSVRFTPEYFDSEMSESRAVDQTIEILNREPVKERLPCVFIGNGRSAVTLPTSIITSLKGYPQISPISTSTQLDDKSQHSLFGRLITSDDGTATPAILFFKDVLKLEHLAIVHQNDGYGNSYARALQKVAREIAPEMSLTAIDIPFESTEKDYKQAVRFLKRTNFRYIFAIIEGGRDFNNIMIEAYNQGIAGNGDHNWFFSDSLSPNTVPEQQYEENSPLHLATRGVFMLAAIGGLPGMKVYDTFVEKWQQLNNAEDIDYFLTNKHPQYDDLDYKTQIMNDEFFRGSTGIVAPFLYDSIIAIGLAACNISSSSNNSFFDGQMHYNQITRTQFEGTTGNIVLDPTTGTRIPESAGFELTNYVETSIQDSGDGGAMGKVTFKPSSSFLFVNGQWKQQAPPIFNDGTSTIQPDLPPLTTDYNYIGTGLRAAGLVMACVVLLLCAGFAGFTIYYRKARAVKASQPIFLLLLIGGIFLMGSSIIPLSIDDEITSAEGCTVACMAVPWLFCTGFSIAFAALSSKLERINKLFNNKTMRRVQVTPRDVMKPLVAFLILNILILSLWTGISPLEWTREVSSVNALNRSVSSVGVCTSDYYLPFVIALVVINLGVLSFAMYQAYHARSISLEFSESEYITKAIASCLLVCFMGIPVMVIVTDQPRAHFFVLASIIFILCSSLLLFIFVPKIKFHLSKNKEKQGTIIRKTVTARSSSMESMSSAQDRASRSTIDYGVKIYDTPAMREETKKKNETLLEENTRLVERVEQLEVLLREANGVVVTDEENVSGCVVDSSNNDASGKSDDTDADF